MWKVRWQERSRDVDHLDGSIWRLAYIHICIYTYICPSIGVSMLFLNMADTAHQTFLLLAVRIQNDPNTYVRASRYLVEGRPIALLRGSLDASTLVRSSICCLVVGWHVQPTGTSSFSFHIECLWYRFVVVSSLLLTWSNSESLNIILSFSLCNYEFLFLFFH